MRILYAGSPAIAVPALRTLADAVLAGEGWELAGILTNPDRPRLRRGEPEPTEVAKAAQALFPALACRRDAEPGNIPALLKPEKLDAPLREQVALLRPDLLVSFAYGRIFGPRFLALFPWGGINIHPSLLPKYRGAAPIPQVILNQERETGITIQKLAAEMDAGDILVQEAFPLTGRETTGTLNEYAGIRGAEMLRALLSGLGPGLPEGKPQNHGEATFCALIKKEDGRINWDLAAPVIDAQVRAYTPWPLCRTRHGERDLYILRGHPYDLRSRHHEGLPREPVPPPGTVLGIDKQAGILIQTGDGIFAVEVLQYAAKKALDWRTFSNGARDFIGSRLT
ncbi:MAG: methionyl-tRNA formyltransferase [Spirochaetaceae bacterium]|jgi:methionyl-tRNA formyltransferase|nr:methionyl-tRNA formyltransferase [Spirochaetaceae bacterium]